MAALSHLSLDSVMIYDDQVLGVGSYGKVCKAKYGQLPCAAKLLHDTMFETGDPGIFKFAERFKQECQFLSMIKHPNIVQYLGTYKIPLSQRLALLMELMDGNLTCFLERSTTSALPFHIQLNICHDVALALSYLHSNAIIHRDLSSNNVLLIGEVSRAKVTDFGMSKLMDMNPRMTPLTVCPGATVYMPPEALTTPPHYSSKLDCFSHGVLTIQILTRNFPKPGDAHRAVEDPNYPTGEVLVKVPETERRKKDIDQIEPNHPLLPLAFCCLHNRATERPSADEVCERLATLKREERYTHSVEQTRDQATLVPKLREQLEQKEQAMQKERESRDHETRQQASLVQTLRKKLQQKEQTIQQERESHDRETKNQASLVHTLRKELVQKEQAIQQERANSERETRDQASLIQTLRGELEQKDQIIQQKRADSAELTQSLKADHAVQLQKVRDDHARELKRNCTVTKVVKATKWKERKQNILANFSLLRGTSLVDGNTAYFSHGLSIYSFTVLDNQWTKLPLCSLRWFAMAVIDDKLTTIGGIQNAALHSLVMGKWETVFPPMPTKRSSPAAVTTPTHLVVAGGTVQNLVYTDVVEVLDTHSLQWFTARSLPEVSSSPKMTLCGKRIYLAGNASMISCRTEELLKSCEHNSSDGGSVWTRLADIPMRYDGSLVSVRGHVLAIGGKNDSGETDTTPAMIIHCYNQATNSWNVVGQLPSSLSHALVGVLPTDELIVVGGDGKNRDCYSTIYTTLCK